MMPRHCIAGVDEAGRGALAGPVVAAACVLALPLTKMRVTPPRWKPQLRNTPCLIADSKLLAPEEREQSYAWITKHCLWGVGYGSVDDINRIGIVAATHVAMSEAIAMLREQVDITQLLVDGRDRFRFLVPHRSIVRGDQTEPAIACASIIAKVTRDRLLCDCEGKFPGFSFARHKGYGTQEHLKELQRYGPTMFHREKFVRTALGLDDQLDLFAQTMPTSSAATRP